MNDAITLFALSTCGVCKSVKRLLQASGRIYDCIDVDLLEGEKKAEAVEALWRVNPAVSFPTLCIGNRVIVGNREEELREILNLPKESGTGGFRSLLFRLFKKERA